MEKTIEHITRRTQEKENNIWMRNKDRERVSDNRLEDVEGKYRGTGEQALGGSDLEHLWNIRKLAAKCMTGEPNLEQDGENNIVKNKAAGKRRRKILKKTQWNNKE